MAEQRRPGRPRTYEAVSCANPLHADARVKVEGTRTLATGTRRDYKCSPKHEKPHYFTVMAQLPEVPPVKGGPAPRCPIHGAAAKRVRYGTYGNPQSKPKGRAVTDKAREEPRRQRYRCTPDDPAERARYKHGCHYFTPDLAREHVHLGDARCEDCEELRGVHRGEQVAARRTTWNLRIVAEGLAKLAAGESYGKVGEWAWDKTGRDRTRPARLGAAERKRRADLAAWKAKNPRKKGEKAPKPPTRLTTPKPLGPGDPVPARRRRVDENGNALAPRRKSPSPSAKKSRSRWHTAADWTEMYSGCLWEPLEKTLLAAEEAEAKRRSALSPKAREEDGRPSVLLLDDVPFVTRARYDGYGGKRVERTYFILAAATLHWSTPSQPTTRAWEKHPTPTTKLRLCRGFATNEAESWLTLFHELGYVSGKYEPEIIVCDAGTGLQAALRKFFRKAVVVPSLWHVREAIEEALTNTKKMPQTRVLTDMGLDLDPRLARVLDDLSAQNIRTWDESRLDGWWRDLLAVMERMDLPTEAVEAQRVKYGDPLRAALPLYRGAKYLPLSTGGFELRLRDTIEPLVAGRSHAFTNINRLACLLDLAVCAQHGVFQDTNAVLRQLRAEADKYSGWAPPPRAVADTQPPMPATYSSLRDRDLPTAIATDLGLTS